MMFQKMGATVEKACFLDPKRLNSVADRTQNIQFLMDLMGQVNVIR